jgi:hypothetical protein
MRIKIYIIQTSLTLIRHSVQEISRGVLLIYLLTGVFTIIFLRTIEKI